MILKECKLKNKNENGIVSYFLTFDFFEIKIDLAESDTNVLKLFFDNLITYMLKEKDYLKFDFLDEVNEGETVFVKSSQTYIQQLNNDLKQIFDDFSSQFNDDEE